MRQEEPADGSASAVLTAALDVASATRRWRVLHAPLGDVPNLAAAVFLVPAAAWFYVDQRLVEVAVVAQLRAGCTSPVAGPERERARAVADTLRARSDRFRALWSGPRVGPRLRAPYEVRHPALGRLALERRLVTAPDGRWREEVASRDTDPPLLRLLDLL